MSGCRRGFSVQARGGESGAGTARLSGRRAGEREGKGNMRAPYMRVYKRGRDRTVTDGRG